MAKVAGFILMVWMAMLASAPAVLAHIEAAELGADVVWDRTRVRLELRVAIRELINAEQPLDATTLPDFNQDANEVARRNEPHALHAFEIRYDAKVLTAKITKTSVQDLVIGVSEEDIVPRKCAVYELEYEGGEKAEGVGRIDLAMQMFRLPPEAGFQPTVLCMMRHRQDGSDRDRIVVIGHEETMTLKPDWTAAPTKSTALTPDIAAAKPSAIAPISAPKRSRGAMIVLGLGAVVALSLVAVLAKKRA